MYIVIDDLFNLQYNFLIYTQMEYVFNYLVKNEPRYTGLLHKIMNNSEKDSV